MPDPYFTALPESSHEERHFAFEFAGKALRFETDAGVFSKQHVDPGSLLLCKSLPEDLSGDVLDMGCGWGAMSVLTLAAHPDVRMTMADVNERALSLARENVRQNGMRAEAVLSDGFSEIAGAFDAVITNPPIRVGKQAIYRMFADAARQLNPGGALYLVIRKQQGAESCVKYLKTLFSAVDKLDKSKGYWVLRASGPIREDTTNEV